MGLAPGGQLTVHDHAGDADALLAARLANGVEAGSEQQLPEHLLDASFWNPRPVVFGLKFDDVFLVVYFGDLHAYVGQDASLFAGVQRIVNGFFDGRDEGTGQ